MDKERGWGLAVITAFTLVSLILIGTAIMRSCERTKEAEDTPPAVATVARSNEAPKRVNRAAWEDEMLAEIEEQMQAPEREYVGTCRLTVYTPTESSWGYQTATGERSQHLMTCAVDPKVVPYGGIVIIVDKDGEEHRFKAVDCGGFSGKWVDIFFDDSEKHGIEWLDECFGGEFAEVWYEPFTRT